MRPLQEQNIKRREDQHILPERVRACRAAFVAAQPRDNRAETARAVADKRVRLYTVTMDGTVQFL